MFSSRLVISNADAARIPLPSNSVHCVVTSPPYYALRAYAGDQGRDWPAVSYSPMPGLPALTVPAMRCNLGNESDPLAYIGHLVLAFREVYRVLRGDGVAWVVMGDSYASEGGQRDYGSYDGAVGRGPTSGTRCPGAAGNLLLIPARLALALEADGWTVRNDCVWAKDAPMPESVSGWSWQKHRVKIGKSERATNAYRQGADGKALQGPGVAARAQREAYFEEGAGAAQWRDCPGCPKCDPNDGYILRRGSWRHTRAHETVLMLSKGMGYFANGEAVREASTGQTGTAANFRRDTKEMLVPGQARVQHREERDDTHDNGYRNPRSVLRATPEPLSFAHYAAYPRSLIAPLVRATCPARVCPVCGAGWAVMVEHKTVYDHVTTQAGKSKDGPYAAQTGNGNGTHDIRHGVFADNHVLGLRPSCPCGCDDWLPGLLLDPFVGSGTSALVAHELGLRFVGLDISGEYLRDIALVRAAKITPQSALDNLPLFTLLQS